MRRACFLILALAALFATPATAAKGFPTTLAGFTTGESMERYEDYCLADKAIPLSDAPFLSEALLKPENLPGVRGGSLAFGNCESEGRLVRIKLKFQDRGQGLFSKLYDRYEANFGKPDKYLGDAFKNVIAWEWIFSDGHGGRVSLVLMWSREKEIRPGVSIKMTQDTYMDEEYKCYKAKHKRSMGGKTGKTRIGSLDAYTCPVSMPDFAWNGIGLAVPAGWEPSAIERDGLFLADSLGPVCELKWNRVHGTFSFDKHLRKLTKGNRNAVVRAADPDEIPDAWAEAVDRLAESGLRARSFLWRADGSRGLGAALHHPGTGLACLIQFFIRTGDDEPVAAGVLATLRDFTAGKTVPWAMFGLAARVPADFVLDTFSFRPGHYRVAWWRPASGRHSERVPAGKGPGTRLDFERFAPASVLLRGTTLEAWCRDRLAHAPPSSVPVDNGPGRIDWRGAARTSLLRRALRREVRTRGRAWTPEAGNAVLAVTAEGTVPLSESTFNDICGSFILVPEETA